jgi:hypothetical protein
MEGYHFFGQKSNQKTGQRLRDPSFGVIEQFVEVAAECCKGGMKTCCAKCFEDCLSFCLQK